MAATSYDEALRGVLAHEGGYTNHSADPGGPTNFGITLADYRRYVKPGATAADVKVMRLDEAEAIYRSKYWDALRCDALPAGVDYCVFDYGVNSGIARSAAVLQRIAGVAADGHIGPQTLAAVAMRDDTSLVSAICDERLAFLKRLKTWPVFGTGWERRVAEVRSVALRMCAGPEAAPKAPTPDRRSSAVAPLPSGKGVVPAKMGARGFAGAIIAGGLAAAHDQQPAVIIVMVAAAVVLAAAWWFDLWRQRRQQLASA